MKRCQAKPQVARISHDYFASFSPLDSDVTEEVKTTRNNRLRFRLVNDLTTGPLSSRFVVVYLLNVKGR